MNKILFKKIFKLLSNSPGPKLKSSRNVLQSVIISPYSFTNWYAFNTILPFYPPISYNLQLCPSFINKISVNNIKMSLYPWITELYGNISLENFLRVCAVIFRGQYNYEPVFLPKPELPKP